jgi:hypothetical protein
VRLFHVSEAPDITKFVPRIPTRNDIDKSKGLVWAINEYCLPNFFTPRECPRITYHASDNTTNDDIARFFSSASRRCVAIEHIWHRKMQETTLYLYEFDPSNFYIQDSIAGYYISEHTEIPIKKFEINDLYGELFKRDIEVRLVNNLWILRDAVIESTLNYSICDMAFSQPRK